MATSRVLVTAALATLIVASPSHAEEAPVVRDSGGAVVGTVLGGAPEAEASMGVVDESLLWVAHPIPGAALRLLIGESGPWDTKGLEPLFYESEDCSGVPLVDAPAESDQVRPAVIFATDVFWGEGAGAPRIVRSRATLVRDPSDCSDTPVAAQVCCTSLPGGETRTVSPVTGAALTSLRLSPPFRVDAASSAE